MFNNHVNNFVPNFYLPPPPLLQPLSSTRVFFPSSVAHPRQPPFPQPNVPPHMNPQFFSLSVPPPPIAQNITNLIAANLNNCPTHRFANGTRQPTTSERFSKTFHVVQRGIELASKSNVVLNGRTRKRSAIGQINSEQSNSSELRVELDNAIANKPLPEQQNADETNREDAADGSPKSKESGCSENSQESIHLLPTDNDSDSEHPEMGRNWRVLMLFNGHVNDEELALDCERPQKEEGRTYPEIQKKAVMQNSDEQTEKELMNPAVTNAQQENALGANSGGVGYATRNVWVSSDLLAKLKQQQTITVTTRSAASNGRTISPPMRFDTNNRQSIVTNGSDPRQTGIRRRVHLNRSLIILKNGRRVYAGSRDCFQFLETGNCLSGVFCEFEHEGSSEHIGKKVCPILMRGQCRNTDDTCPHGPHSTLKAHQMPVCDYYLKMCCSRGKDQCAYLHVKHTDGLDPCEEFNKGCCQQGVMCDSPHRYRYYRIKEKQMEHPNQSVANQPDPVNKHNNNPNSISTDKQSDTLKWFS